MEAHDFKLNKVPLFPRKSVNTKVSLSAATKLALVPASRYYCCDGVESDINRYANY